MARQELDELGKKLYSAIREARQVFYPSGDGTNVAIRCPYCGDSQKSDRSAHFYVRLIAPYKTYCQRCNLGGQLDAKMLRDIGVHDTKLMTGVESVKEEQKYARHRRGHIEWFPDKLLVIPPIRGTKRELANLAYVNGRLGSDIEPAEAISDYRIIANFSAFLEINRIPLPDPDKAETKDEKRKLERKLEKIGNLHKEAVGFLSYDQTSVNFRARDPEKAGFRYDSYTLFDSTEQDKKYFTVRSEVDVLAPRLKVVLTEGIFDLIGVQRNVYGGERDGTFWCAVNGKGYNLVLLHLMRVGFLDLDVNLFSDRDVDLGYYRYLFGREERLKEHRYTIHYNRLGKDFGVPKDQIEREGNLLRL